MILRNQMIHPPPSSASQGISNFVQIILDNLRILEQMKYLRAQSPLISSIPSSFVNISDCLSTICPPRIL